MTETKAGCYFRVDTHSSESGQAVLLLLLILGVFLLASLAFAVDLSNMWVHRQATQTAADAACQAGAMDMLAIAAGSTPPAMGFTLGQAGNCSGSAGATMCTYANFNGYSGTGLSAGAESNSVSWMFPGSVAGATGAPASMIANSYLKVTVQENVKTWFMGLLGVNYQQVASTCTCGVTSLLAATPLVVLSPTAYGALSESGTPSVAIVGGPTRSMQVNSNSTTAVSLGGNSTIDLSQAGPLNTGGSLGVVGGPITAPSGFNGGTTGRWQSPSVPLQDPYATVPAPTSNGGIPVNSVSGKTVAHYIDGCPDTTCTEYSQGYYPNGISVSGATAIFMPGIYYLGNDLKGGSNSILRNGWTCPGCTASSTPPSAADGVMFYLTNGGGLSFAANSGSKTVDPVPSSYLLCSSSQSLPSGVPTSINGNVLWAQCTSNGTYAGTGSADTESTSGSRGLLMFLDRTQSPPKNLQAGGGGSMAFAGAFYFHHNTSYDDIFSLQGGSGTGTYIIGEVVADQLSLGGNGSINMALSKDATTYLAKSAIFQ